jgi:hypothetical protein
MTEPTPTREHDSASFSDEVTNTLPFALAVPSGAQNVVVPHEELKDQLERETDFLKTKGVEQTPVVFASTFSQTQSTVQSNLATTDNTVVGTQTFSGNPVVSDDTTADTQADAHPDQVADSVTDTVNDD